MRARWRTEDPGRGTYVVVISEMPWLVQKSRLVEKLAELLNDKKLPLVADVRDESAEDVRLVIEPRSRTVDAELLMESLFKLTELESRIPLNMNVLVKGRIPQVLGLAEVLREWLDHRRDVLLRRSKHRLAEIEHRLEVLDGYLIAFLNLDEVIRLARSAGLRILIAGMKLPPNYGEEYTRAFERMYSDLAAANEANENGRLLATRADEIATELGLSACVGT